MQQKMLSSSDLIKTIFEIYKIYVEVPQAPSKHILCHFNNDTMHCNIFYSYYVYIHIINRMNITLSLL